MANLEGWLYRKKITVTGSTDGAQTDYTIPITVHFGSGTDSGSNVYCSEHCATDFDDIRFTAADGTTLLNHWRESKTDSDNAVYWIKIPSIDASPATLDVYVYYGNATAANASSAKGTFILGVDGEDPDLWKPAFANASSKLEIPCYDDGGSSANQAIHPSILDFGATGWNGYRYWMGFTPYPANQSQYENPSIVVSSDGVNWSVPTGLANPIVPTPVSGYNADIELVYKDSTDEIWMYYKYNDGTSVYLAGLKSSDGIAWTDLDGAATTYGTMCITFPSEEVSFSIIKDGASSWKYWAVHAGDKDLKYRTSSDGKTWSTLSNVLAKDRAGNSLVTFQAWHPKVRYIAEKSLYVCLAHMGSGTSSTPIMMGTSSSPTAFNYYPVPVVQPSAIGWDNSSLYRPDFLYDSTSGKLRVWYSARNSSNIWGIGYTEADWDNVVLQAEAGGMSGMSALLMRHQVTNWFRFDPSTDQVAQGEKSVRMTHYGQAYKDLSSLTRYDYRGRFYDGGGTSLKFLFHIGSATAGLHLGISTQDNASNYVYLGNGVPLTSTGVARSTGWHSFRLYGSGTSGSLEIDGSPIATLSGQIDGVVRARIIKELNDTAYVDSLFIRTFATNEPAITAYATEEYFPISIPLAFSDTAPATLLSVQVWSKVPKKAEVEGLYGA